MVGYFLVSKIHGHLPALGSGALGGNLVKDGFNGAEKCLPLTVYVLAMVGHLKNVSPTFAQMPYRITNVEFTTVSPTIANTILSVCCFSLLSLFFIAICLLNNWLVSYFVCSTPSRIAASSMSIFMSFGVLNFIQ